MNLLNKDQTIGMTNNKIELLEYDIGENKLKIWIKLRYEKFSINTL